jgi:hypothetical protein
MKKDKLNMKSVLTIILFLGVSFSGYQVNAGMRSCIKNIKAILNDPKSGIKLKDGDRYVYLVKEDVTDSVLDSLESIEDCHKAQGSAGEFEVELVRKNIVRSCYWHRKLIRWYCESSPLKTK